MLGLPPGEKPGHKENPWQQNSSTYTKTFGGSTWKTLEKHIIFKKTSSGLGFLVVSLMGSNCNGRFPEFMISSITCLSSIF